MQELVEASTCDPFTAQHLLQLVLKGDRSRLVARGCLVTHLEEETALSLTILLVQRPPIHFSGFVAAFLTRRQNLSGPGSSHWCCRETRASVGDQAWTRGLGSFSLVPCHDPRLRLNFGEAVTPAGFAFTGLGKNSALKWIL